MEKISKKRRGRPLELFVDEEHRQKSLVLWNVKTDRTHRNRAHYAKAMEVLGFGRNRRYLYLADAARDRYRFVILTELGKFKDPRIIRRLAAQICKLKLKTAEAVAQLHKVRKSAKSATVKGLVRMLAGCVDRWMLREGASFSGAAEAADQLRSIVATLIQNEENS